jgi:Tol biopolymer transport system component
MTEKRESLGERIRRVLRRRRWRRTALVVSAAVIVVVIGAIFWRDVESFAGDHWRELLASFVIVVFTLAFARIVALIVRGSIKAAVRTAVALAAGAFVVLGIAIIDAELLPFVDPRESAAARSLGGVVGNGTIAFASAPNPNNVNVDIYVVDPEGADIPTPLTEAPGVDTDPAWSPDGTRIAFMSTRERNDPEIYVMDADGSDVKRLTEEGGTDRQPAWSPDGDQIAFMSTRHGNAEIYVMNTEGGDPDRLTTHPARDTQPVWSPDGERIAFTTTRGGNPDVYVMDADGENARPVASHGSRDAEPSWGADGAHLVFASVRDRDFELYRYLEANAGKPVLRRATRNKVEDRWPAWAPDGGQLAFVRVENGVASLYVDAEPKRLGASARRVTRQPVELARPSWQPAPRVGLELPDDDADLADRYAPVVYLHPYEVRLPMDASAFVRRSHLRCGKKDLGEVEPDELEATSRESCGRARPFLVGDRGSERGTRSRSDVAGLYTGVPVYWERVERPAAITYWLFYGYSVTRDVGRHQGDWEGVTICLGEGERPQKVVYYQHKRFVTRAWAWAPKFGAHPLVYSALGSHASYPERVSQSDLGDTTDEGAVWPTWDDLHEATKEPWYDFLGRWGRQASSPRGIPTKARGRGCA